MAKQPTAAWKNRIVGYGEESPDQLLANPLNFRTHPKNQQDTLAGVLSEVGVVQNVIVNKRTGFVVDGHLRISLAMREHQPTVPVTYVDLDQSEEALILATLDPISAMATADRDKLDELLRDVSTGDAAVMQMLADLAADNGIVPEFDAMEHWQGMPAFEQEDQTAEFQAKVNFKRIEDVEAFEQLIDQHIPRDRKSIWYPAVANTSYADKAYVDSE